MCLNKVYFTSYYVSLLVGSFQYSETRNCFETNCELHGSPSSLRLSSFMRAPGQSEHLAKFRISSDTLHICAFKV